MTALVEELSCRSGRFRAGACPPRDLRLDLCQRCRCRADARRRLDRFQRWRDRERHRCQGSRAGEDRTRRHDHRARVGHGDDTRHQRRAGGCVNARDQGRGNRARQIEARCQWRHGRGHRHCRQGAQPRHSDRRPACEHRHRLRACIERDGNAFWLCPDFTRDRHRDRTRRPPTISRWNWPRTVRRRHLPLARAMRR